MVVSIKSVKGVYGITENRGIKGMVYGRAGVGKTLLGATAPGVLYLSGENGLLSLRKYIAEQRIARNDPRFDLPVMELTTLADLREARLWIASSKEARNFMTFYVDSISEFAENDINAEKKKNSNLQKAYGAVFDNVMEEFRQFRNLNGPNIWFTAKEEMVKAGVSGAVRYIPMFPGQALNPHTPYMFDETFNLNIIKDAEQKDIRVLKTQPDYEYDAKDRSGQLAPLEWPNLEYIFKKIKGEPV